MLVLEENLKVGNLPNSTQISSEEAFIIYTYVNFLHADSHVVLKLQLPSASHVTMDGPLSSKSISHSILMTVPYGMLCPAVRLVEPSFTKGESQTETKRE